MSIPRLVLLGLLAICWGPASAGIPTVSRFGLGIDTILKEPIPVNIDGLQLTIPVVEVNGNEGIVINPGTPKVDGFNFIIPEVDDEVLVAFFSWFETLAAGNFAAQDATITGFNGQGRAVMTWTLNNAWVSKIVLPAMNAAEPTHYPLSITLQADLVTPGTVTPNTPLPEIVDVAHNRAANTFTMRWRSVAGATYDVRGWDPVTKEPIVHRSGIVATGDITPFTASIIDKGLFYAVLTAEPGQ